MIIIVGLGNPGEEYANTRHNVGWRVIDELIKSDEIAGDGGRGVELKLEKKFQAFLSEGRIDGEKILFVKPTTFMNLSGEAVKKIVDYYQIEEENIWLITDDLDLPLGKIRVRHEGSDGGHNGLKSIIECLKEDKLKRIRVGIAPVEDEGEPMEVIKKEMPAAEIYVLQSFNNREEPVLKKVIGKAVELIVESLKTGQLDSRTISVI